MRDRIRVIRFHLGQGCGVLGVSVEVGFAGGVEVVLPGLAVQGRVERREMALGRVDGVLALGGVLVAVDEDAAGSLGRCCVVSKGEVLRVCWRRGG